MQYSYRGLIVYISNNVITLQESKAEKGHGYYLEKQVKKIWFSPPLSRLQIQPITTKGIRTCRLNEHGSAPYQPNNALKATSREGDAFQNTRHSSLDIL